jgi:hypothetical protein
MLKNRIDASTTHLPYFSIDIHISHKQNRKTFFNKFYNYYTNYFMIILSK